MPKSTYLTKTQWKILQHFTAHLTKSFTISQVAKILKLDYALIHRSTKPLIGTYIKKDEHNLLSIDYKKNHQTLAYVESLRPKLTDDVQRLCNNFIEEFKEMNFSLLIFGSTVINSKPRDLDILIIVDNDQKMEPAESLLEYIAETQCMENLHVLAISYDSVFEMLAKRERNNVINEVLNKHFIIYGAELFFRLLSKGR